MSVIALRLRDARTKAGLTQEKLGIMAGIDEMSASARMNQYERDVHVPNYQMAEKLAEALDIPVEYLYAKDDVTAELLLRLHRLDPQEKQQILAFIYKLSDPKDETRGSTKP